MSHRLLQGIANFFIERTGDQLERSFESEKLSSEEQEILKPYVKFILKTSSFWHLLGSYWPIVGACLAASMGALFIIVGIGVLVSPHVSGPILFKLIASAITTIQGPCYIHIALKKIYPRLKLRWKMYEILLNNPRLLLDPDHRSQFESLINTKSRSRNGTKS